MSVVEAEEERRVQYEAESLRANGTLSEAG